jgi:hypothetical protein
MYWLQDNTAETDPLDLSSVKGSLDFISSMQAAIAQALNPATTEKFFLKLEQDAKSANAKISNQFTNTGKVIENLIFDMYQKQVKLGFEYKDTADYLTTLAGEMGRMVGFTKQNVEAAIMLGKAMGVSSSEVAKMYAGFTKMGLSQEYAQEKLNKVFETARKYGLDASKLTKTVSDNVFKSQAYGFKDGVDGLTKMAAQAQKVGISMELASKAAEKAFDPEGAIEMASSLQMLGGNMGSLTDFHSLMYMAQSDTAEFQNQIGKAGASMVDFNKTTGEFSISPEMRRNMTEQAKAMGMSYDEYADLAIKFKKQQEVMSRVDLTGMNQEQKDLISSFAEIGKGGTVKVQIPGMDELKDVSQLTSDDFKLLKTATDDAKKSTEDVARDQLSVLKNIENALKDTKLQGVRGGLSEKDRIIDANKIRADEEKFGYKDLKDELGNVLVDQVKTYATTIEGINNTLITALKSPELNKGLDLMADTIKMGFKAIEDSVKVLSDLLKGDGQAALSTIQTTIENIENETKKILTNAGLDTQKIEEFIDNKIESLKNMIPNVPVLNNSGAQNIVTPPQIVTPNPTITPNQVTLTTPEQKTQTITFDGTSTIKIDIDSSLPKDVLSQILTKEDVKLTVKEKIREMFSKSYNQDLVNSIPIDLT